MNKLDVLNECTVQGCNVKLPDYQLDRKVYLEVKKALELIGGKWKGGKVAAFVFSSDPTELLSELSSGGERNLKKEYQFFATPPALADRLVELAEIEKNMSVLEPSAGQGAIIEAVNRLHSGKVVDCYEPMPVNKIFLKEMETANHIGDNFLINPERKLLKSYDRIIANPPFSKNQDIDHVREMWSRLDKSRGLMVSIMSNHWTFAKEKKCEDFRNWLETTNHWTETIQAGEFKESGTMVGAKIVVIFT